MRQLLKITTTFTLALVFTAGMAFGQVNNEAYVDQSSDDGQATVTQTGASNFTDVEQDVKSKAAITQAGDNNDVLDLNQTNSGGADGFNNTALVDQVGDGNVLGGATSFGSTDDIARQRSTFFASTSLDLDQIGDFHRTNLFQQGETTAEIEQRNSGDKTADQGNTATVIQQDGGDTYLDLLQAGLRNESKVVQGGGSNSAEIYVTGNGNEADAEQEGGLNELYLNMEDAAGTVGFDSGNTVDVDQTGGSGLVDAGVDGDFNTVTVTQSGLGNTVDGSSSGVGQADGLFVDGNNNTVTVTQSSDNNQATIETVGNNNTATVTQQNP
ncbi:curlin repeat-containing protein [Salinibacter altiplanensis]|uniref:curlin repeat-containing protein n=1 Tax=Salinibacter altiplanensis TaxID=1803181 RepID=UPI000C9F6A50|nr:curlin repeat-containing protein [Salinibacter altiplanensis]